MSYCLSDTLQTDRELLFFAYGSGSKAKVFTGKVQPQCKEKSSCWDIARHLEGRVKITFDEYIALRKKELQAPLANSNAIAQESSGISATNKFERTYTLKK